MGKNKKKLIEDISNQNSALNKTGAICCGNFEKYAKHFNWMSYSDDTGKKLYVMPHINIVNADGDIIKLRINNCPTCGFELRGIELSQQDFDLCK